MKRNRNKQGNERANLKAPPSIDAEDARVTTKLKDTMRVDWPIAISALALIVSISSALLSYLSYMEGRPFIYTFKCEKIEYQSTAKIKTGPQYFDYAEIETNCDLKNIGSRAISILRIEQFGIDKSTGLREKFGTSDQINQMTPKALNPGEAFSIDEVFLIPIKKNWNRAHKACVKASNVGGSTVTDLLNCLGDIDDFHKYLQHIEFPGPAGGSFVFNRYAIEVEIVDGTQTLEDLELAPELRNTPFRTH